MQVYKSEFSVLNEFDGWEVIVHRDDGKLFQMSGPQTANERRPKSVPVSYTHLTLPTIYSV